MYANTIWTATATWRRQKTSVWPETIRRFFYGTIRDKAGNTFNQKQQNPGYFVIYSGYYTECCRKNAGYHRTDSVYPSGSAADSRARTLSRAFSAA